MFRKKRMPQIDNPAPEPRDPRPVMGWDLGSPDGDVTVYGEVRNGKIHINKLVHGAPDPSEAHVPLPDYLEHFSHTLAGFMEEVERKEDQDDENKRVLLANEITNHFFNLGARVSYEDFEFVKDRL